MPDSVVTIANPGWRTRYWKLVDSVLGRGIPIEKCFLYLETPRGSECSNVDVVDYGGMIERAITADSD